MNCPKCESPFETVKFADVSVRRCSGCGGIWFSVGTLEQLKDLPDAGSIDTGDPTIGKQNNAKGNYACPECAASMIRLVDSAQPHLWYESCSECFGVYFDAGEFRDYQDKTILDSIRDLFAGERP